MPQKTFTIDVASARLAGLESGAGLPVVFLHAGVADSRMWSSQIEAVAAAGFRAVSYDRRGFGESESVDEPFSHLSDLETVLERLGIHAAVFVGASMGGALAIDFALEYPERVVGLVLVGTALSGAAEPELPDEVMPLIQAMEIAEEREDIEMLNRAEAHAWLDGPMSANGRVSGPVRELFLAMNGAALAKPRLTHEEPADAALDYLAGIEAPVLLAVGSLDFPHIIARHDELSEEFDNAFAIVIENTAHLPPLERPDLFNPLLLEFLAAITGGEDEDPGSA
jgi:pimeloyl-ACP methyl ester carboxylesterase